MAMEAESLSLIYWGFYVVGGFSLLVITKLWMSSKDKSFIWFIAQLFFLYLSFLSFTSWIPGIS